MNLKTLLASSSRFEASVGELFTFCYWSHDGLMTFGNTPSICVSFRVVAMTLMPLCCTIAHTSWLSKTWLTWNRRRLNFLHRSLTHAPTLEPVFFVWSAYIHSIHPGMSPSRKR